MQFRILGTLEVTADGEPVALGGPKPRALLAALLLRPGAAVSTDRLVEAVWGDAPPPNALSALRAYVSRLRTVLGSVGGAERLRYRAPGYVLALADGELDAAEFARLISLARGPAATAEYEQVVQLLDTALGLWRDDPLAEFAHLDFVGAAASRLADLRLTAIEERADALLRLGRGSEVVAELAALFQTYPERERLAVLLMRGLYGCGRQADALAVYQELRRRLVGDLGVEPSEPARALQRQMLTHDPALVPPRSGPPSNLPRRASSLIGRDDEIRRVTAAMRDASMVTLTGVGGVGKSRLALEAAGQDRSRFP
ncbi:MAG: hypothetical protein QOF38_4830, partial [Pseudonocardiales bacterium]|nr:hypothetical protein [Pseudonocardiales bacterium]